VALGLLACSGDDSGTPGGPSSGGGGANDDAASAGGNAASGGHSGAGMAGNAGGNAGASVGADANAGAQQGQGGAVVSDATDVRALGADAADATAPSVAYPATLMGGDVPAGIAHLNVFRALVGASTVTLDAASSTGCEGHLAYLVEEQTKTGQVMLTHDESDHANSHYSVANEQAGMQSDLAYGQDSRNGPQSLANAVDLWMNGLYHRRPLLDPGLVKVGAASNSGYNCLNYRAPGNTVVVIAPSPTLFPPNGTTDVPRTFVGSEGPCPTTPSDPLAGGTCPAGGFIPSATFYNWGTAQKGAIDAVSGATLTDVTSGTGTTIPLLAYYAGGVSGHDPAPGYVPDEIALVPMASLAAGRKLRVDIAAVVKGMPTTLSWTFTTGTRTE
jgi:hypothetical protein